MRFDEIEEFSIDDLLLDEANYRFKKAKDQKACIRKIFTGNPSYFKGLMKSIAEDDLGEPLLVFRNTNNENIVVDGNRRLSALKVLYSDEYAPVDSIRSYAQTLRDQYTINFPKIHAQVSEDKKLVSRTVFERHSSGKNGTSRIPWAAYAAARFGFDEKIGNSAEWHIMALLSKVEEKHPDISDFLDDNIEGNSFSYEVFRRLVRGAIQNDRISRNIFAERGEKIKKTARPDLITDAVAKAHAFLLAMQKKEISLSRKGDGYADKDTVDKYLNSFSLSPDNQELEDAKAGINHNSENSSQTDRPKCEPEGNPTGSSNDNAHINDSANRNQNPSTESARNVSREYGITKSDAIINKLEILKSKKLISLYNSLCRISLNEHPALMYVGAWSFFEVLSKLSGNINPKSTSTPDFPSFFRQKMKTVYQIDASPASDYGNILDVISKYGNATKHSQNSMAMSAIQLRHDFEVMEPLILAALDESISRKKKAA